MTIPLARKLEGKKFMWDGGTRATEAEAEEVMHGYEKDGFETRMFVEDGQYLVYSRRVATVQSGD
ncbi:MAG: hypothetical protein AB1424_14445 [Thermodesulfobacteriota bacterium]